MIYITSPSTDPRFNLALEQYVFDEMDRCKSYFMLWQNDNTIVVGKHQNTVAEVNGAFVREHAIRVVRRLSGGGAVYHDLGNLNFTYIVDRGDAANLDFKLFSRPVAEALRQMGVEAQISGRNDILINGKKFSGNSQYMKEGRLLHHGTMMFDSNLEIIPLALQVTPDKIQSKGIASVRSRVTNIKEHLPQERTLEEFKAQLLDSMFGRGGLQEYHLTASEISRVREIQRQRYDMWEWNYGESPQYSIKKERRVEGCGTIQLYLEVSGGIITRFASYGDYFGSGDTKDVACAIVGQKAEEQALLKALEALPLSEYYHNLTPDELVSVILQ